MDLEETFEDFDEVAPLDIADDLTIEDAEKMLIQTVNYGDYLAAERKKARLRAKNLKKAYKHHRFIYLKKSTAKDAKTREAEAEDLAREFFDLFDEADIEADYIKDLLSNNHDKTEALRSVLSSKKRVFEQYERNRV
jgi:isopenicillin N synthase-like dioxygenase